VVTLEPRHVGAAFRRLVRKAACAWGIRAIALALALLRSS
jgi:hypothetical protein